MNAKIKNKLDDTVNRVQHIEAWVGNGDDPKITQVKHCLRGVLELIAMVLEDKE